MDPEMEENGLVSENVRKDYINQLSYINTYHSWIKKGLIMMWVLFI